jgi:hypothetical protein
MYRERRLTVMIGTNRLVLCPADLKVALATYLNEHVFQAGFRVTIAGIERIPVPGQAANEDLLGLALVAEQPPAAEKLIAP